MSIEKISVDKMNHIAGGMVEAYTKYTKWKNEEEGTAGGSCEFLYKVIDDDGNLVAESIACEMYANIIDQMDKTFKEFAKNIQKQEKLQS